MSVFHRVDDYLEMDCLRFFRLAYQLVHYQGALRAQAEKNSAEEEGYSDEYPTQQHGSASTVTRFDDVKTALGDGSSDVQARGLGAPWFEFETA